MDSTFPNEFVWGAASSAFQIEGGAAKHLRGESVWDRFCRRPDAVRGGADGRTACDHFHRYEEDVRLMRTVGLRAYRFSIAWPRVIKDGVSEVNPCGLDFYDALVDRLLENDIEPWVTLFHWDLPVALHDRGGWLNRASADWFAHYAATLADRLSDRVTHWITLNEPQVFLRFGYAEGTHAPGLRLSLEEQLLAAHHVLLAHGRAVQAIRAHARSSCRIGFAPNAHVAYPASDRPEDVEAARRSTFEIDSPSLWSHTWFADPVFRGAYPEDGLKSCGDAAPKFTSHDMETISQPLDFLGLNLYAGVPVRAGEGGMPTVVRLAHGHARNALDWPVAPEALRWGTRFLWERYAQPIVITENGMSNLDWVDLDGRVRDPQRIDFTRRYLIELGRAIADGADVRGYFHWSIMDNFEWAEGYKDRFGLIHVDFETQRRTLKDSAHWYRRVIESNGAVLALSADSAGEPRITAHRAMSVDSIDGGARDLSATSPDQATAPPPA